MPFDVLFAVAGGLLTSVFGGLLSQYRDQVIRRIELRHRLGPAEVFVTLPLPGRRQTSHQSLLEKVEGASRTLEKAARDSEEAIAEMAQAIGERRAQIEVLNAAVQHLQDEETATRQRIDALQSAPPETAAALIRALEVLDANSAERSQGGKRLAWVTFAVGSVWTLLVTAASILITLWLTGYWTSTT
jgi:hypothetical protein